ncbi:MAG: cyclic nucleotide-binding domain-containing protein, partial [Chloroflexi bacterium]|nr:cyclic nucleotide-binding domain-containing protein [Chloroflexota bacterium]
TRVLWGTVANGNIVTAYPVGVAHELTTFYEAGGKIGLMGQNGLIQTLLKITPPNFSEFPFAANVPYKDLVPLPIRPYLHFGYNSLVVLPTVIAFLVQVRRLYDVYLAKAFPKLSETQLIHVSAKLEHVTYAPGAIILRQDDSADKFCLIVKGQVEVVRRTPRGQEIGVTRLGEGQYFGEIGLMHGGKNIMTVRAATYVEVAELNRAAFQEFVGRSDLTKGELERMVRDRVLQIKALQAIG